MRNVLFTVKQRYINGKGYYNDMFAPGWTVASLWELLTPGRTENILLK